MSTLVETQTTASATTSAEEAVSATAKLANSAADKPKGQDIELEGTEKKDIRKHPKYSFLYEVHRYNALYHVSIAFPPDVFWAVSKTDSSPLGC